MIDDDGTVGLRCSSPMVESIVVVVVLATPPNGLMRR
jgi:hypothetical protein